ncbi:MAG: hypothetical protein J6S84_08225 [Bacteroidales bacterium]|nr:hypothetical protein [Bacteroidales bacterium]MBO7652679.1 hypothetical protein [Bacteroidales bacterium]
MKIDWEYLVISVAIVLLGVGMFLFAHFFCNVSPNDTYCWYHGIYHGIFSFPNWVMSWFSDRLWVADIDTNTAYKFFYWIFKEISALVFLVMFVFLFIFIKEIFKKK